MSAKRKTHLVRGDRSACGMSGPIISRLDVVAIPAAISFGILKQERRDHYMADVTCMHCIRRRYDL